MAILAISRFKLPELRQAGIRMGKGKYQLLRRLGKRHQLGRPATKCFHRKTKATQEAIKSVENFAYGVSNPSTVYLTVPGLCYFLHFSINTSLVKDRWAFVDGVFPLLDREALKPVTEEEEKISDEEKEVLLLFLSLKRESEDDKKMNGDDDDPGDAELEAFYDDFSHATFEEITMEENGRKVCFSFLRINKKK
jgi:hypothetical protein